MAPDALGQLVLTLAVGFAGAGLAFLLRVPAAALIGPIVTVGLLQFMGAPLVHLDREYRFVAQALIGATVASTFTPGLVSQIIRLAGPTLLGMVLLVVLGVVGGWVLHLTTGLPLASALFAGAPGGVVEMALAAGDLGGDTELVAAIQLIRLLTVIVTVPPLLTWVLKRRRERTLPQSEGKPLTAAEVPRATER